MRRPATFFLILVLGFSGGYLFNQWRGDRKAHSVAQTERKLLYWGGPNASVL